MLQSFRDAASGGIVWVLIGWIVLSLAAAAFLMPLAACLFLVVGALLFLTDERSSGFITGVVLPVDGGFSAYSGV